MDNSYMLRDGSTAVTGTENGDYVNIGKSPLHNAMIEIYLPTDGTSITITIQQADDAAGTNVETVPAGSPAAAITAGAKTYTWRLYNTRPWIRYIISAVTGSFGAVQVGVTMGDKPTLPA